LTYFGFNFAKIQLKLKHGTWVENKFNVEVILRMTTAANPLSMIGMSRKTPGKGERNENTD